MSKSRLVILCVALYALSFLLPAGAGEDSWFFGFQTFQVAFDVGFGQLLQGDLGALRVVALWAANPVFWMGILSFHYRKWPWALGAGVLSFALGLIALLIGFRPGWFPAYYVWLGSFAALVIASLLIRNRTSPVNA
jgi:hypothetical protein